MLVQWIFATLLSFLFFLFFLRIGSFGGNKLQLAGANNEFFIVSFAGALLAVSNNKAPTMITRVRQYLRSAQETKDKNRKEGLHISGDLLLKEMMRSAKVQKEVTIIMINVECCI